MDSENKLSREELVILLQQEREAHERTKQKLLQTEELLAEVEKWWKDSSQANFSLAARLKKTDTESEKILAEERRQKLIWKEAYESVTGSRTWKTIGRVKRVFGKK